MFSVKKHPQGFSFVEIVSALAIAGVVSVTGLNSYRKQRHQARAAQAQYSLSNIYTAEKNFEKQWGTFHENLYIIGAIPEGELWYDAGFTQDTLSNSDGNLGDFPWKTQLTIKECNNFYEICKGDCASKISSKSPGAYGGAGGFTCSITGGLYVKDLSGSAYAADASTFTAIARSELSANDEWTINQNQEVQHITDGTGN